LEFTVGERVYHTLIRLILSSFIQTSRMPIATQARPWRVLSGSIRDLRSRN
jgi:hypothetical protein